MSFKNQTILNKQSCCSVHKNYNLNIFSIRTYFYTPILILITIVFVNCTSNPERVFVRGTLSEKQKNKLLIYKFYGDSTILFDSLITNKKGKFNVEFDINSPSFYLVTDESSKQLFSLLLNPSDHITVTSEEADLSDLVITGSRSTVLLNQLDSKLNRTKSQLDSLSFYT